MKPPMKLFKRILLGLLALVGLLLVIGLFLPSTWRVERSIAIKAPPERITPLIVDLHRWKEWAAWNDSMDPTMVTTYDGPALGVGASMHWTGEEMGTGTLVIRAAGPTRIEYDMTMEEQGTPARGQFILAVDGDATTLTWIDEGDMGFFIPGRYFRSTLESMLGEHFDVGLGKLKEIAEGPAGAAAGAAAAS